MLPFHVALEVGRQAGGTFAQHPAERKRRQGANDAFGDTADLDIHRGLFGPAGRTIQVFWRRSTKNGGPFTSTE